MGVPGAGCRERGLRSSGRAPMPHTVAWTRVLLVPRCPRTKLAIGTLPGHFPLIAMQSRNHRLPNLAIWYRGWTFQGTCNSGQRFRSISFDLASAAPGQLSSRATHPTQPFTPTVSPSGLTPRSACVHEHLCPRMWRCVGGTYVGSSRADSPTPHKLSARTLTH